MGKFIMVGCDLHDAPIVLKVAEGREKPRRLIFKNTRRGRAAMMKGLKKEAAEKKAKVVFAYEASSQGFGLCDDLTEAGIECHVLAPTKMRRSPKEKRTKNNDRDAERILELLRGYVLAGNELPSVWLPDKKTRDDREIVRARLDAGDKLTSLKAQVRSLLKRNGIKKPNGVGRPWTRRDRMWLQGLAQGKDQLPSGAAAGMRSLLRQIAAIEKERKILDEAVEGLSQEERYAEPAAILMKEKGVGMLVAMTFLTEMGDLGRFGNRKQVGSYLGLAPSSNESGEDDRKGHITHLGPARVRKVLCQASWNRVKYDPNEKEAYERIVRKNPKHRKIAVVASMRRLAVHLWHRGLEAQQRVGSFSKQEATVQLS
jgi:transposase